MNLGANIINPCTRLFAPWVNKTWSSSSYIISFILHIIFFALYIPLHILLKTRIFQLLRIENVKMWSPSKGLSPNCANLFVACRSKYCEAQARVRQGPARDGSQGERPQSLNPCLELTLKLVATAHHHPKVSLHPTNGQMRLSWDRWR